jgi:epoxyqueuosine reductase
MTIKDLISNTFIKAEAKSLGFDFCGLATNNIVDDLVSERYKQWLKDGKNADMTYLNNYTDKRSNPALLVENARTIISVALNYYPKQFIPKDEYQIAYYAYGKDYHEIIKNKLEQLLASLKEHYPTLSGRYFCDTAPVLERYWAWKCGLGWIGKNTMLIIPEAGSYFFLGELIIDFEADKYDSPLPDRCGNCTKCLDGCPTGALEAPKTINANKCINYLTIENKNDINAQFKPYIKNTIYGCDKCQIACPWNKFAKANTTSELQPKEELMAMKKQDWQNLTEEEYRKLFKDSAIKRAKYKGLKRNISIIKESKNPDSQ